MLLYHGSNTETTAPEVIHSCKMMDFGAGFYLFPDKEQAIRQATAAVCRRGTGTPTVSVFNLNEQKLAGLALLKYEKSAREWLDCVAHNRTTGASGPYDVIIGPSANDTAVRAINGCIDDGKAEIALKRLEALTLADQYAFKTDRALAAIEFISSETAEYDGRTERLHPAIIEFYDRHVVEMIADNYKVSCMDAFKMFAISQTHRMLEQRSCMMCDFGYPGIFEIWETEKETGNPRNNPYLMGDEHD